MGGAVNFFSFYLAVATAAPAASNAASKSGAAAPTVKMTLSPEVLQQLLHPAYHQSWLSSHAGWLTHSMAGIFITSAVALVILLAVQTTKQEGLSGTIGGRVESAYRPRLGFDQQLARITGFIAICFVVFATLVSLAGI
jgi:protein translocase SecG subunit